jgi:hypothetical protein
VQLVQSRDSRAMGNPLTIPAVMASPDQVEKLLQAADPTDGPRRTLVDFRKKFDEAGGVIDFPAAKVSLTTRIAIEPIMTDNVGGILRGKGSLKDEYLVIGAHYDHVGYGPWARSLKTTASFTPAPMTTARVLRACWSWPTSWQAPTPSCPRTPTPAPFSC